MASCSAEVTTVCVVWWSFENITNVSHHSFLSSAEWEKHTHRCHKVLNLAKLRNNKIVNVVNVYCFYQASLGSLAASSSSTSSTEASIWTIKFTSCLHKHIVKRQVYLWRKNSGDFIQVLVVVTYNQSQVVALYYNIFIFAFYGIEFYHISV